MSTATSLDFTLADPALWIAGPPNEKFTQLRTDAPLSWHEEPKSAWFPEGGRGFWSLVRHADIQAASKDQGTFSSGQGTELIDMPQHMVRVYGGMLNMTGEEHAKHRAIVSRIFSPKVLSQLTPRILAHAKARIERVKQAGEFDFVDDLVGDFPAQIICDLMGVPAADRDDLIRLTGLALMGNGTADSYASMLQIVDYARGLARTAGAGSPEEASVLRRLVEAEVDGQRLTNEEVGIFIALLLTAGIETTSTTIAHGFYGLALHPDQREKWKADYEGLAPRAVEELVRWVTPVMHFRRTATRDIELHGQTIRSGDKVLLWYLSGNRDERVFTAPERLDFDRPDNPHVAFGGGGPHFCLGAMLARLEITVFFRELFAQMPDVDITGDPVRLHSNFVNAFASLPARVRGA